MAPGIGSFVTEFILVNWPDWTDWPDLQLHLLFLFIGMYMVTVMGNLGLITIIGLNSYLHTLIYFFLFSLSLIDICYSSIFTPNLLINFISKKSIISYVWCMTQLYFLSLLFLNAMCWHQWPMTTMWPSVTHSYIMLPCPLKCVPALCLVPAWWHFLVPWLTLDACWDWPVMQTLSHFCDIHPLLQLSCTSTYIIELEVFIVVGINITVPSFTIFVSYGIILSSILHIKSVEGRPRTFSTYSSHITAVSLFFGSYVSKTIFYRIYGWGENLFCLLYQCSSHDELLKF